MSNRYFVRHDDVAAYHPANHTSTVDKNLIDPKLTGAKNIGIMCGTLQPINCTMPHANHGIGQGCYILEGAAIAEVNGQRQQIGAGDCSYFAPDMERVFTAIGAAPCKVPVIYSPHHEEDSSRVLR
jgi:uncharacterized cupin superfamily protein